MCHVVTKIHSRNEPLGNFVITQALEYMHKNQDDHNIHRQPGVLVGACHHIGIALVLWSWHVACTF